MSFHALFVSIEGMWGKTAINCFVMITGYFMCTSHITIRKFLKLLLEIEFYNVALMLIFMATGYEFFSFKGILHHINPITSVFDLFVSCYLLFFLFIPFLNILIHNMNRKQHGALVMLLLFIYTFLGTIPYITVKYNYVSWFIVIYFIASYIRLYPIYKKDNTSFWGCLALASICLSIASVILMQWHLVRLNVPVVFNYVYFFVADSNKILATLTAICLFMFFNSLKIKNSKIINTIAASTFGVFLIHDNCDSMRQWLWTDLFNNREMFYSNLSYIHEIGIPIMVFAACAMIDYIRIHTIEKPVLNCTINIVKKLKSKF